MTGRDPELERRLKAERKAEQEYRRAGMRLEQARRDRTECERSSCATDNVRSAEAIVRGLIHL
jgi:hypothetical protein